VACQFAQQNRREIIKALQESTGSERRDMSFLVANMPLRDLTQLKAEYLLENVRYAQKGLAAAPWKNEISQDLYREYILPYASITEKRQAWRQMFFEKLQPLVKDCKTSGEAAVKLNQTIYELFKVKYHATRRSRPDQGPLESIAAGYASCTGLSVLLVNACRAVGIPARIAGVAEWTEGPGNHTWVEVWDNGWHCLGASESKSLNGVWFGKGAAAADASNPMKRIYAACFHRTTLRFPFAWNPYADYVPAVDVTDWYKEKFGEAGDSTGD
jgi:transglutaminase-like putative cysteine protease